MSKQNNGERIVSEGGKPNDAIAKAFARLGIVRVMFGGVANKADEWFAYRLLKNISFPRGELFGGDRV